MIMSGRCLYPPKPSKFIFDGQIGRYDAVPIERVDTVEESTPYELGFGREFQRVWLDEAVSFEPSEGATKPQVASENPQVTVTHTGQRGWLGRWLHRKRRTR